MPACKLPPPACTMRFPLTCGKDCPVPYSLSEVGITQSLLGSFQTCRRRFLFDVNRWSRPDAALKFEYGTMVHEVLDRMYTGFTNKEFKYGDLVDVITAAIDAYRFSAVWSEEAAEIARAKAQAMLECYILVHQNDFSELRFEEVEGVFAVMWRGFKLRGKKDGRFRAKDKSVWHIEHKNYSRITEDIMPMLLTFDLQNLLYLLADMVENKRLLSGVLYNILRNPEVRKKDGTAADLYKVLKEKIMADPRHYFIRYEIPYDRKALDQFEVELFEKLSDLDAIVKDNPARHFVRCYKNEHACESPYRCDYVNVCASGSMFGLVQTPKLFEEL